MNTNKEPLMPKEPPPTPRELKIPVSADLTECRVVIEAMVKALNAGPRSRARSVAVTHLDTARMWLEEALRTE